MVTLAWQAGSDGESPPVTYGVWLLPDDTTPISGQPDLTTGDLNFDVTGLTNGEAYYFEVHAQDDAGNWETTNTERLYAVPFRALYELTLTSGPNGAVGAEPEYFVYEEGAEVSVIPTGLPGYTFSGWTGDVPAGHETDTPLNLVMDMNRAIEASFTRAYGTVVIDVNEASARWSFLDGDGLPHTGTGPTTVPSIPTGGIILTWEPLTGYTAPPSRTKSLSAGATVVFSGVYIPNVIFNTEPLPQRHYVGETATFEVAVTGGLEPLHFAWRFDSPLKSMSTVGANQPVLLLPVIQLTDAGDYWCEVTDAQPFAYASSVAVLEVAEHLTILQQPQGGAYVAGESHTFSVDISGGFAPLNHTWKKEGSPISSIAIFELTDLEVTDSGSYCVEIIDDMGDVVLSKSVDLQVDKGIPTVTKMGMLLLTVMSALSGTFLLHSPGKRRKNPYKKK